MTPVAPREAECHSLPLWPLVERVPLGEWELRTDPEPVGRLVKRANSCLAMGDPGLPAEDAADVVAGFYAARDRPALVQVELGSTTEHAFGGLGWEVVPGGDAHFLVAPLADVLAAVGTGGAGVVLEEDLPRVRAFLLLDGVEVAAGRGAVDDGWLAVHGLAVDPAYRRQGHATVLMAALLAWGAGQGAATVLLHVETDNTPALAMYDALGFRRHHTCRYLRAG